MAEGERQLWCAVIAQAITDATTPLSERLLIRLEQVRAREWFIEADQHFQRACALAGYEPDRIRTATVKLIEAAKRRDPDMPQRPCQRRLKKNMLYHHEGQSLTIPQWGAATGLSTHLFYAGIRRGKSIEQILNGRGRAANFEESRPDRCVSVPQDI